MRFLADGPDIPIELLEDQRLGKVLFFCGAGISRKAELPDFAGLAEMLLRQLGSQDAKIAFEAKESLDRVFGDLVREFGRDEVEQEIFSALKIKRKPFVGHHETILKLSCNPSGDPQIVTTNFDLLFETAKPSLKKILPPALPDMGAGQRIDGVVYLHGRLRDKTSQPFAPFVVSNADFGRAYLADGWATRFIKELRETYTIVLLGYSADDPPMRYLLEGLNARADDSKRQPIYAFTHADEVKADNIWRDRGVRPICYRVSDGQHSGLWDSLAAWAEAAGNEAKWYSTLLRLSQSEPLVLQPFERGQVAYFALTLSGAKKFSTVVPPPSAEWLLVFDSRIRLAKSKSDANDKAPPKQSFQYGLDSDFESAEDCVDVLLPIGKEIATSRNPKVYNWANSSAAPLPERLRHLAQWFTKVSNSPVAIWWMAGQSNIHPEVALMIDRRLRADQSTYHDTARKLWNWMIEAQSFESGEFEWFDFIGVLKSEGWTGHAIRKFRKLLTPYVRVTRRGELPEFVEWGDATRSSPRALCELKVIVMERHSDEASIPIELLHQVVSAVSDAMRTTAELLKEIETNWWRTHPLFPAQSAGLPHQGRKQILFQWLASLMVLLSNHNPNAAKAVVANWDLNDTFFFGQLGIYVSQFKKAFTSHDAAEILLTVSDDTFWNSYCQHDLLTCVKLRWRDFSLADRARIERRFLRGPQRFPAESTQRFGQRRISYAAGCLTWLTFQRCKLSPKTSSMLLNMKARIPDWDDAQAKNADYRYEGGGGWVQRVTDPTVLTNVEVGKIIPLSLELSVNKHHELKSIRPFDGLVTASPRRALAALRYELRHKRFEVNYWMSLIQNWPDNSPTRAKWLLAISLSRLDQNQILELKHCIPSWLSKNAKALYQMRRRLLLNVYDLIAHKLIALEADQLESAILQTTVGGKAIDRSQVSLDKAINSPIGILAECLWSLMPEGKKGLKFPKAIEIRVSKLFDVVGSAGGHAVCVFSNHLGYLDYWYRDWTQRNLVPRFQTTHPHAEAAWHGFGHHVWRLSSPTFSLIKQSLEVVLRKQTDWELNDHERREIVNFFVFTLHPSFKLRQRHNQSEARAILIALSDADRVSCILALKHETKNGLEWRKVSKPFIKDIWPRQHALKTPEVARAFAGLLEHCGSNFPDAAATILRFMRPVPHLDTFIYRLTKDSDGSSLDFIQKHPFSTLAVLDALIGDDRFRRPWELPKVLAQLVQAEPNLLLDRRWQRLNSLLE